MNILILTPYLPFPPHSGGSIRTLNLIKMISKNNHVSLISLVKQDEINYITDLRKYCDVHPIALKIKKYGQLKSILSKYPYTTMLKYYSSENQKHISSIINDNDFDIIQVESPMMSAYVSNINDIPKVLDAHNIESDILYRILINKLNKRTIFNLIDYLKDKNYEKKILKYFDVCLSVSDIDNKRLKEMGARKSIVLPNCVDLNYFCPNKREDFSPKIVFTGLMNWFPNIDAVEYFCRKAYPALKSKISDIKFYVVGRDPIQSIKKLDKSNEIFITGRVDDIRTYIINSDICIVPLRIGGGTRLKILEYLAMEKPVVSTSIGVEGIDVIDGIHLIIEDDIGKFSDRIIELLENPEYARNLAKNGRELVEKKYSWSGYEGKLNQLYKDIV